MENMMRVVIVLFLIAGTYAANYSWPLYPIASEALYGYDQTANKSFRSENIRHGVRTQVEDGIHALFVSAGVEIDLGDFAGTCISDPTLCKNFTVSFLFKTAGADKDLKILDSGMKDGNIDEYGWSFEITSFLPNNVEAMVADGNIEAKEEKLAATNTWIQMAFTFDPNSSPTIVLFQNGSRGNPMSSASSCALQDKNTRLKLGSSSNIKGFFISNLNFIGIKLSDDEIQEHGNSSFKQAMEVHNVTVEILKAHVIIQADAAMATIPLRREEFLGLATAINYDTKSLTAEPTKHFKAATGQQLVFAPGEIYKHVQIDITNTDDTIEGNKTFQVIFSSPQKSVTLTGPKHVNITIMYTEGNVHSKGATTDGYPHHCFIFVLMNLLGVSLLIQ